METYTRTGDYNPTRILDELQEAHAAVTFGGMRWNDNGDGTITFTVEASEAIDIDAVLATHDKDGMTATQANIAAMQAMLEANAAELDALPLATAMVQQLIAASYSATPDLAATTTAVNGLIAQSAALQQAYNNLAAVWTAAFAGNATAQTFLAQSMFASALATRTIITAMKTY